MMVLTALWLGEIAIELLLIFSKRFGEVNDIFYITK